MNKKYVSKQDIEQVANGRWDWVLEQAGIPSKLLNGKHQPCPSCGGSDRFRFTNYKGTGTWICNQCQPNGASPFDLVMAVYACDFKEACDLLAHTLGLQFDSDVHLVAKTLPEPIKKEKNSHLIPIVPVPDYALKTMDFKHKYHDAPITTHIFRNGQGQVLGGVARFVRLNGKKMDLPYTFCHNIETNTDGWEYKCWNNLRPLYGLDHLAQYPDMPVLIVEGEKCKAAVDNANLGGIVAITWHGGCNNWDKSDWSPICNRRVIMWADADSKRESLSVAEKRAGLTIEDKAYLSKYEQGGMKAMLGIAAILSKQNCDICFVALPDAGVLPDGYDIADALAEPNPKLPVHDILSWQGAANWLLDYDTVLNEKARVFAHSENMSVRTNNLPISVNNANGRTQPNMGDAGQNSSENSTIFLENLLENYAVIGMKDRAINLKTGEILSRRYLEKAFNKDVVLNWLYHKDKKCLLEFEAEILSKRLKLQMLAHNDEFSNIIKRYIYLDGTTDAFDIKLDNLISLAAVKAAIPDEFDDWAKSPSRLVCPISNYVFEPALPTGISYYECNGMKQVQYINNFKGFEINFERVQEASKSTTINDLWEKYHGCHAIIELIWHLCSGNGSNSFNAFEWVLNWLACRLRFPHKKPATAMVFISEVQGVGKSTFGEKILKGLFTRYCRQLDQNALESRFNSSLLFALITIFEEISPSDERMNIIGKLKNMITSDVIMIERKGRDATQFSDYNSFVIFSNDQRSIPIESNDRRFMVLSCNKKYSDEQYNTLMAELKNDGLETFAEFLFALPLMYTDEHGERCEFNPHSKPIMTPIKKRMIVLNKPSWEAFYDDWRNGDIHGLPFVSVASKDLWAVYVYWCEYTRTAKMKQKNLFASIGNRFERDYRTSCNIDIGPKMLRIFALPHQQIDGVKYPLPNTNQTSKDGSQRLITTAEYYGKQIMDFHKVAEVFLPHLAAL